MTSPELAEEVLDDLDVGGFRLLRACDDPAA